jgi:hypothetical protein
MTNPSPFGQLPQSSALAEASPDSVSILMDKDPEQYTRQDRDRIVKLLRANRERLAAAEAAGPTRKVAQAKVGTTVVEKPEDLGL